MPALSSLPSGKHPTAHSPRNLMCWLARGCRRMVEDAHARFNALSFQEAPSAAGCEVHIKRISCTPTEGCLRRGAADWRGSIVCDLNRCHAQRLTYIIRKLD